MRRQGILPRGGGVYPACKEKSATGNFSKRSGRRGERQAGEIGDEQAGQARQGEVSAEHGSEFGLAENGQCLVREWIVRSRGRTVLCP